MQGAFQSKPDAYSKYYHDKDKTNAGMYEFTHGGLQTVFLHSLNFYELYNF